MGEHLIGEGDKQLDRLRQDSQKFRQVFDEAMQDAESRGTETRSDGGFGDFEKSAECFRFFIKPRKWNSRYRGLAGIT